MATLAIMERVEHQHADETTRVADVTARYYRDQPDGDHPAMVALATSLLADYYERFMARGSATMGHPSGPCVGHRVLAIIVVMTDTEQSIVTLATKELES